MANFFTPKKRTSKQVFQLELEDLDTQAQGVGRWQKRVVFVPGGLPGERVQVQASIPSKGPIKAELKNIAKAADFRVEPLCSHYGQCGGCRLQHVQAEQQILLKQQALHRLLTKRGIVVEQWAEPICSEHDLGYRIKARLAVDVRGRTKIGFRHAERQAVVAINQCPVLAPELERLINPLKSLVDSLAERSAVGHIELLMNTNKSALWLHRQGNWNKGDQQKILTWCEQQQVQWLDDQTLLSYQLNEFDVTIHYRRNHFIQSNRQVNEQMVSQAMHWLDLAGSETVLDLFCGAGNFSLPLAKCASHVIGVEGLEPMVEQARANAASNNLENAAFYQADLNQRLDQQPWWQPVDAILLDPARAGAQAVVEQLHHCQASKVLYVSCNPTTLVRDAEILQQQGYKAVKAGVMDMFPHTHHLESMILFSKN